MNSNNLFSTLGVVMATSLLLTACGGGGGGGTAATGTAPVVTQGVIEGFGSICINGVRYGVDGGTSFNIDDSGNGGQDDMKIGMVATIQGRIVDDSASGTCPTGGSTYTAIGVADSVEYDDEIQGPVAALDTAAGTFTIAGITIQTDADTVFRDLTDGGAPGLDINDMNNNEYVEVSGLPADGKILATYVEGKGIVDGDTQEYEVKGTVSALNTGTQTFTITLAAGVNHPVEYSGATVTGSLSNGALVEVKGAKPGATINATRVDLEDSLDDLYEIDDNSEIEGVISNLILGGGSNPIQFDIGDITVDIANAEIENGELLDLAEGVRVEVEGYFDGSMVVATKIEFHEGSVKLVGQWDDATDRLLGIDIVEDAFTQVRDENGATITLAGIANNDYVEVKGFETADGKVRAKEIEIETVAASVSGSEKVILQGKVDAFNEGTDTITILGITVDTSGLDGVVDPSSDFEGLNDNDLSRAAFYGALSVDMLVKARGASLADFVGGNLTADQVELED